MLNSIKNFDIYNGIALGIVVGIFLLGWLLVGLFLTWLATVSKPVDWEAIAISAGLTLVVPVGLLVVWLVARADHAPHRHSCPR